MLFVGIVFLISVKMGSNFSTLSLHFEVIQDTLSLLFRCHLHYWIFISEIQINSHVVHTHCKHFCLVCACLLNQIITSDILFLRTSLSEWAQPIKFILICWWEQKTWWSGLLTCPKRHQQLSNGWRREREECRVQPQREEQITQTQIHTINCYFMFFCILQFKTQGINMHRFILKTRSKPRYR